MIISSLMRTIFFFIFVDYDIYREILKAFYLGFKFDFRVNLIIIAPLLFSCFFSKLSFNRKVVLAKFWRIFYTFLMSLLLIVYFIDFGFYDYLNTRFNSSIINYILNFKISMEMIWQSYPVVWGILIIILCSLFFYWFLRKIGVKGDIEFEKISWKKSLLLSFLFCFGIYGKFSYYPLRWSEVFFTQSPSISSLAMNPLHYFFDTIKNAQRDYDIQKVIKYYPIIADYLNLPKENKVLNYTRDIKLTPFEKVDLNDPPNIVVIIMESFASFKTGILGNTLNPTPNFDHLARNGILFENFYTPSEGTARGMFALLTGIPDVALSRTSSRNPLVVNQHTVVNAFYNYKKFFIIGGSANWGNIRGVYNGNILDLNIIEEGMHKAKRVDVWGISDLDLLREAHGHLNASKRPFFAIIQSAGFHRPYTIPKNKGDFKIKGNFSNKEFNQYGFLSKEEYNSMRFSDYSIGQFFKLAKNSDYFKNTIFAILGDHGLPSKNSKHVKEGFNLYQLERFRVPFLIYAPYFIKRPKRYRKIATQLDVFPTLAAITGRAYKHTTLGRNLFAKEYANKRYAFNYLYHSYPPRIGMISDKYIVYKNAHGYQGLYNYSGKKPREDLKKHNVNTYDKLKELTEAIYHTSKYMLYNNPNLDKK